MQPDSIGDLTSSSPEIGSGESSLSNGHSLSDVISDWKRELEEKNCMLRDKITLIHSLENQLKQKTSDFCDVQDKFKSVELDRDKNCQMVSDVVSSSSAPRKTKPNLAQSGKKSSPTVTPASIFNIFMFDAPVHSLPRVCSRIYCNILKFYFYFVAILLRRLISWKVPYKSTTSQFNSSSDRMLSCAMNWTMRRARWVLSYLGLRLSNWCFRMSSRSNNTRSITTRWSSEISIWKPR